MAESDVEDEFGIFIVIFN